MTDPVPGAGRGALPLQLLGVALFLFIPLVLFLLVRHPQPVLGSLLAAVALMAGHRFLARPYMRAAAARKCLWCNRALPALGNRPSEPLPLLAGAETVAAATCPGHAALPRRFLAFLDRHRWPLRAGIFLPLLLLVGALVAAAAGEARPLPRAVALFQLLVGLTVNAAAFGYLLSPAAPTSPARVPFPAHNFFLLGIRNLLWIFRLVGLWWIARGAWSLLG